MSELKEITEQEKQLEEIRLKVQNFSTMTNKEPRQDEVFTNEAANNTLYIPISHLQMKMDEWFFGQWQEKNYQYQVVGNEVVGSIEVEYLHPVTLKWLTRTGAAAVIIRQKSGAAISDIEAKYKNALVMDFPHLKAQCFRSAVGTIAKSFGRDLNREKTDVYEPRIKEPALEGKAEQAKQNLLVILDEYQGEDKASLQNECAKAVKDKKFTVEFAESIANKIGVPLW